MLTRKLLALAAASAIFLSACATPAVVDVKKVNDASLSCEQLVAEIDEAKSFEDDARSEKGVTGKNAAAVIFFWPAAVATYVNVEEAIDAADKRQAHLYKLYEKKNCS